MGLEAGSFVNDLNVANPVGAVDQKSAGDDHLRLIKTVLKATFPLAVGARKFSDTDAGAADTLAWTLFRNSASPATLDLLGSYAVSGNSTTAVERVYARLQAAILTATNAAEDGMWLVKVMVAGAETTLIQIDKNAITMARGIAVTGVSSITGNTTVTGTLTVTG